MTSTTKIEDINSDSSLKDIARAVRAKIKEAKKSGLISKGTKVSVRTQYYSMGCSLNVTVTKTDFAVINPGHILFVDEHPHDWHTTHSAICPEKYTEEAETLVETINQIVKSYHWNKSDMQTDYYHVNFSFCSASFCFRLESNEREEIRRARDEFAEMASNVETPDLTLEEEAHADETAAKEIKIKGWEIGPGADLEGADLEEANLADANLEGANLKHTKLDAGRLVFVKEEGE